MLHWTKMNGPSPNKFEQAGTGAVAVAVAQRPARARFRV